MVFRKCLSSLLSVITKISLFALMILKASNLFLREFIFSWPMIILLPLEIRILFKISIGSELFCASCMSLTTMSGVLDESFKSPLLVFEYRWSSKLNPLRHTQELFNMLFTTSIKFLAKTRIPLSLRWTPSLHKL